MVGVVVRFTALLCLPPLLYLHLLQSPLLVLIFFLLDRQSAHAPGRALDALVVLWMRPGEDAAVAELAVGRVDQSLVDPPGVRFVPTCREAKRGLRGQLR